MIRPLEQLSHRQRAATPLLFALHLVGRVRALLGVETVAALWVAKRSIYHTLPDVDCWDEKRDAWKYEGPYPIVAHPPCGPWGNFRGMSRESIQHGIRAMELVHRWGGVVEHPLGSPLFEIYGRTGWVERVNQADFGHQAIKATRLYWCAVPCPPDPKRLGCAAD